MDGSLSSNRHEAPHIYRRNHNHNRGSNHNRYNDRDQRRYKPYHNRRGGGHGYRGGGGGSGHGGYHEDHRHHQHPHNGRRGRPGNRFENRPHHHGSKSVDPQDAMSKQLSAMVAKMGDLTGSGLDHPETDGNGNENGNATTSGAMRMVVRSIGRNIQDLTTVLCGVDNAPLFLKHGTSVTPAAAVTNTTSEDGGTTSTTTTPTVINAAEESGLLASLTVSCASSLPLQTPSYIGLTLGVEETAPGNRDPSSPPPPPSSLSTTTESRTNDPLALDVTTPSPTTEPTPSISYKGFASRCIIMACRRLAVDLDTACGVVAYGTGPNHNVPSFVDAFQRCKLLLRYFAGLARVGIISSGMDPTTNNGGSGRGVGEDGGTNGGAEVGTDNHHHTVTTEPQDDGSVVTDLSMEGLLRLLIQGSIQAVSASRSLQTNTGTEKTAEATALQNVAVLLSILVLSTLPFVLEYMEEGRVMDLLGRVEDTANEYVSSYRPGGGGTALLLEREQTEEDDDEEEEEEEEEDDDEGDEDGDEGGTKPVCADNFQDQLRTVRKLIETHYAGSKHNNNTSGADGDGVSKTTLLGTRYALPSDAPWNVLRSTSANSTDQPPPPSKTNEDSDSDEEVPSLSYSGTPVTLSIPDTCRLLPYLNTIASVNTTMGEENGPERSGSNNGPESAVALQSHSLEGIVFGRLSIFDPPPSEDDGDQNDEEEDDDDDDEEEDSGASNPEESAYVKTFSLVDRYFLSEAVRDVLVCHRPNISETGLEKGSGKDVAEQIWAVCHLFSPPSSTTTNNPSSDPVPMDDGNDDGNAAATSAAAAPTTVCRGFEYGVVETILSLILQAPRCLNSTSPLSHVYLSRVLLALTKYRPSLVPQCLAIAVSTLMTDFVPSMSPVARDNFSCWFSFHLTNTDYQWPAVHWEGWTKYLVRGMAVVEEEGGIKRRKRNSRGECVADTIQTMVTYVSSPKTIVEECLPPNSLLCDFIFGGVTSSNDDDADGDALRSSDDTTSFASALRSVAKEVDQRIWNENEDPEAVREMMVSGGELSESVQGTIDDDEVGGGAASPEDGDKVWWRTGAVVTSLLRPVVRDRRRLKRMVRETRRTVAVRGRLDDEEDNALRREPMDVDDYDPKEDVITDVVDALSRYKTVVLATLAKDVQVHEENLDLRGEKKKSEADVLLAGEVYVLRRCEHLASYSSVVLLSCIETCVAQGIVSALGVLRWALDDCDGDAVRSSTEERDRRRPYPASGWWKPASAALRIGVDDALSPGNGGRSSLQSSSGGGGADGDIGMIIDSGGDVDGDGDGAGPPSARRMKVVTDYAGPLLDYAVARAGKLLEDYGKDTEGDTGVGIGKKKQSPVEVDLVEGLKYLVRSTKSHIVKALTSDAVVKATAEFGGAAIEVENWVAKCKLGGTGLGS